MTNFYEVLVVAPTATLDEIKLAFKRQALQVHPDKGGSKESFHLVYQALETLADPEARRKYDETLMVEHKVRAPAGRKTRHTTRPRPAKHPRAKARPMRSESKQGKLLIKIHDLLKRLPREVRNEVITQHFSQKQRLLLEKWMVEMSTGNDSGRPPSLPYAETAPTATETFAAYQTQTGPDDADALKMALPTVQRTKSSVLRTVNGPLNRHGPMCGERGGPFAIPHASWSLNDSLCSFW